MTVRRLDPDTLHRIPDRISQIVVSGSLAFVSGQVAWDAQGNIVGATHREQTEQISRNLQHVLDELGVGPEAIVSETIFVVGHTPELSAVIVPTLRANGAPPPASTYIGVEALYAPEVLVEVNAVIDLDA
ncbi:RidA family protein [Streptomyces sp. NPDC059477]|uniref:RidA family protein n=1 Tax=Streptomyces sp. NPDC059477 TaxID=3346847 RepID=UPI00367C43E8